jgi:LPXTG-motif cell wall-anchored protein
MKKILIIILAAGGLMATNAISQTQENLTVVKEENVTIVTGQIVSVSTVDRTMTIKGNVRGQDNVYQVPETMKIIKNGREVRLRALTAGDLIEAKYYEKDNFRVLTNLDFIDPEGSESNMAEATPVAIAAVEEDEVLPTALPKTASSLPLYGAIGFLLLALAGVLRVARTKR